MPNDCEKRFSGSARRGGQGHAARRCVPGGIFGGIFDGVLRAVLCKVHRVVVHKVVYFSKISSIFAENQSVGRYGKGFCIWDVGKWEQLH